MRRKVLAGLAALAVLLAGCATLGGGGKGAPARQGWTASERRQWYAATQGSRLVPRSWAQALIDVGSGELLFGDATMARFGYLPSTTAPGLQFPVGFAVDDSDDSRLTYTKLRWFGGQSTREQWLGMNCAACHTGIISHNGQPMLIDGAPTMADYQAFLAALDASLAATLNDQARFAPFAARVLGSRDTAANQALLKQALAALVAWEARVEAVNRAAIVYGPARLDAFGHIFNKVALVAGGAGFTGNPADAPVSYPFLWNTHQADRLQWNGIALNQDVGGFDVGALGRNVGEAIGVFGDVAITPNAGLAGYPSSAWVSSLAGLEILLSRLQPPLWPQDLLGAIDRQRAAAGQALYARNCAGCHQVIAPLDLTTRFKAVMIPFNVPGTAGPGTDMAMACNAYQASAPTGKLEGTVIGYVKPGGARFGPVGQLSDLLPTMVVGVIANQKAKLVGDALEIFLGGAPSPRVIAPSAAMVGALAAAPPVDCHRDQAPILAYKARPLNGIWATGPFLHNGSVPTLYDLLLPPAERPERFLVGTREYDPAKVGFVTAASPGNSFLFDTRIPGNLNIGHDFSRDKATGQPFSASDRLSIVEYMKTL